MGRNGYRFTRSALVSGRIEGQNGWNRDPHGVGAGPTWDSRFEGLPFVRDGREETGMSKAGRGTTAFDLFRKVEGLRRPRFDFLSLKTGCIGSDDTLPSQIEVSTGNVVTLDALLAGINRGSAIPTLVFASRDDENGEPEWDGFALKLDLGPILRAGIASIDGGPYGKGKAPPARFRWSSARPSGNAENGKATLRTGPFPCVDEQGRKWSASNKVHYRELVISLYAIGVSREHWVPMNAADLPEFLDSEGPGWFWNVMSNP